MKRGGLTIIEVLVGLAVLGAVFAAVAATQVSNLRITRAASVDTSRLERAVDIFEDQKRLIEEDFLSYLDCPSGPASGDVTCSTEDVTITGNPYVEIGGASVPTRGMVEVDISVADDEGALRFRQFLSCLESTEEPRPSVALPGARCS